MPLISTLISALFVTVVLIPLLMRHAVNLRLVDVPNERKVHTALVPRIGGIAMIIGMLVPVLFWFPKDRLFVALIAGVGTLACFGVWDDRSDLNYRLKFGGQILASLAVMLIGDLYVQWLPFYTMPLDQIWLSLPITLFCLLAITNAMNLSDGLDGLAGGASVISFGVVGFMGFQAGSYPLVILTLAVAGSILGFLRFNSHPARIFMGDTGSQFLGFVLGVMVILLTQKVNTALSPVLPLFIFGVPVIDTVTVMIKRIMAGNSPFAPDKNHLHHRLLACGFSHYETVVLLYCFQFGYALIAYLLRFHVDAVLLSVFLLYSAVILTGIHLILKFDWVRKYDVRPGRSPAMLLRRYVTLINISRLVRLLLLALLATCTLSALVFARTIAPDIAILAAGLSLLAFLNLALVNKQRWADAVSIYTACALTAYLGFVQGVQPSGWHLLDWSLVIALGVAVWFAVMLSNQRMFETSPLDFLVIIVAVLTPLLVTQTENRALLTLAVIKFVVLLYAFEFIRSGNPLPGMGMVRGGVAACMLVIGSSLLWNSAST